MSIDLPLSPSTRRSCRERGFTLVELTVATGIALVLILAVAVITRTSGNSMEYLSRTHRIDTQLDRALRELGNDLRRASASGIVIDTTPVDFDVITLQVPDPAASAGVTVWGYPDASGVFQPGFSARYLVSGGTLVRRVLDGFGAVTGGERTLCLNCDGFDSQSGEKGFQVRLTGGLADVVLTVREDLADGTVLRRTQRTALRVVNP